MPAIAKNQLTIEPLPEGGFRLFGYINGEKFRRRSPDRTKLETFKAEVELNALREAEAQRAMQHQVATWLTQDQVRDAEAAFRALAGKNRTLLDCVTASDTVLGDGVPVAAAVALDDWLRHSREKKYRHDRTLEDNENRVKAFLAFSGVKMLGEISPNTIEDFVFSPGDDGEPVKPYTQVGRARVLNAWLNFCVGRKYLRVSPVEIDIGDLAQTAKRMAERPRILSVEQCERLLHAAATVEGGDMLPFAILSTWCFMRAAEARRIRLENINLDAKTPVITVWPRKRGTASHRVVTVPANVVGLLRNCVKRGIIVKDATEHGDIPFSEARWANVRESAGLIEREAPRRIGNRYHFRRIIGGVWQENILRHTGISYLYQKTGDITDVTRQAGNSDGVAFGHYIHLPIEGAAEQFYAIGKIRLAAAG